MKNNSTKKSCKKKRKSAAQLKSAAQRAIANYDHFENVFRTGNSIHCSSIKQNLIHCGYKFIVTRTIRKNLRAIKRTVINERISETGNAKRISINHRISHIGRENFNIGWKLLCNDQFIYRFTPNFLKDRSIKMANSSSKSNQPFPNIKITFDQMLSIRKKRLDNKHRRLSLDSTSCETIVEIKDPDPVVEVMDDAVVIVDCHAVDNVAETFQDVVEENQAVVEVNQNMVVKEDMINENQDLIEIRNDANVVTHYEPENNNVGIVCKKFDNMEQNNQEIKCINATSPENSNNVEENDQDNFLERNEDFIVIDSFSIDDSVINLTSTEVKETPKKITHLDDISNQSVIFVTSSSNDLPKPPTGYLKPRRTRWSSTNSVITIPDTPDLSQDVSDNDIIFVSEENRKCKRESSVVILDDDNYKLPVIQHRTNNKKAKKQVRRRKNKQKKRRGLVLNQGATTSNAVRSELASCADVNCINRPNDYIPLIQHTVQPCACQRSKSACSFSLPPNFGAIPEESSTVGRNNGVNPENATIVPLIINHLLTMNRNDDNLFGSNIYNAGHVRKEGLRQIIIDGSNVALGHTNGIIFSVKGLQIAIDYFIKKGHKVVAFVPQYRVKFGQSSNPDLLQRLHDARQVVFTPSREVKGRRITPYDDRYIIQYATTCDGVVVSNDHFRDLLKEKPEWRQTIEKRLLMYTWVDDVLIFPEDPLGRHGPNLNQFLRFP